MKDVSIEITFGKDVIADLVEKFGVEGAITEISQMIQDRHHAVMVDLRNMLEEAKA